MASFREHIAIGAIIAMAVTVAAYAYALVTSPWLLLILFVITVIGSFLPDVDSDSGMPFYLVFGTATIAATGVVLLYTLSLKPDDWRYIVGVPFAALLLFWFVVGGIVKRCTHHRGIYHSIPALGVAATATYLIARHFGLPDSEGLVFGAAMAAGFGSHLVMDEVHSEVNLEGTPFVPNKALGTAFKLFSDSHGVTIATYSLLAVLVYLSLN